MNSVAVKTLSYVGLPQSAQYISNFGVNLEYFDQNYALALGATANGVSPTEICSAYTALANNGIYKENSFVKYVAIDGNKIYISSQTPSRSVVKSSTASIITSALSDTVKDGTARTLCALPFEVAAKRVLSSARTARTVTLGVSDTTIITPFAFGMVRTME